MINAGISPQGMVTMFQKLLDERQTKPAGVDAWFQTHPLEESRIADIQALIAKMPAGQIKTLTTDSKNFHTFKSRILSLPPSPTPRQ